MMCIGHTHALYMHHKHLTHSGPPYCGDAAWATNMGTCWDAKLGLSAVCHSLPGAGRCCCRLLPAAGWLRHT